MDETTPLRLSALIDEGYLIRGDKQWPTYTGGYLDRSKHVSSSEIGGCARKIKFSKTHPTPPFTEWGWAERGNMIEAWAVDLIRLALKEDKEWRLLHAGENQSSFVHGYQSGTPDGLLVNNYDEHAIAVEFKSVDPRTNYSYLPKDKHMDQVQQNMDLLDSLTPYSVKAALLIHIDASNLQKRKELVITAQPRQQEALRRRAQWIIDTPVADLPAEGMVMDKECNQCPFVDECNALIRECREMKQAERAANHVFKI